MTDLPFPLRGNILITGPTASGKTRLTARALEAWVQAHGPRGVVILDFAPDVAQPGRTVGVPLHRHTELPTGSWHVHHRSHAPRLHGRDAPHALHLAHRNHAAATQILHDAPKEPAAVFVNDATLPYHHPDSNTGPLLEYAGTARLTVLNAHDGHLGPADDPITQREQAVLRRLRAWADHVVTLPRPTTSTTPPLDPDTR